MGGSGEVESTRGKGRCLHLGYTREELGLVPPAQWTEGATQTLKVGANKTLVLTPRTMVVPSYAALHTDPRHLVDDSLAWRPQCWITTTTDPDSPGGEELISPARGTFLGWSEGARDCPGRKFSRVEFVATMVALFKDARLDPVLRVLPPLSSA
jgi:cytochrome P450